KKSNHLAGLFAMQKFIQTYIIFKERVILRIVKLFFHNNLTDSYCLLPKQIYYKFYFNKYQLKRSKINR
ncbi:hypothetical protein P5E79_12085, partial [Clostridium perfringens]|nr:hypothetical protein [Clostridium perfringens]MDK0779889.1 hypothetical protein [Clostridium perfringens]